MKASIIKHVRARTAAAIVAAGWLGALGIVIWQARRISLAEQRASNAEREVARLRSQASSLRVATAPAAPSPSVAAAPSTPASRITEASVPEGGREAEFQALQSQLGEARGEADQLRARIGALEEDRTKAADAAQTRYTTAQADWQSRLDALNHQLEIAQSAAEASRNRTVAVEASLARQTSDQAASQARAAETRRLVATLQDLNRRRESYLNSILRRYRDVLGQLHAMGSVLDSSRDQSAGPVSNAALARIESTISLAEDDMRQLSDVNGRALEAERKIGQLK